MGLGDSLNWINFLFTFEKQAIFFLPSAFQLQIIANFSNFLPTHCFMCVLYCVCPQDSILISWKTFCVNDFCHDSEAILITQIDSSKSLFDELCGILSDASWQEVVDKCDIWSAVYETKCKTRRWTETRIQKLQQCTPAHRMMLRHNSNDNFRVQSRLTPLTIPLVGLFVIPKSSPFFSSWRKSVHISRENWVKCFIHILHEFFIRAQSGKKLPGRWQWVKKVFTIMLEIR